MFKIIKKISLSLLSVLGVSFICWTVILLNPSLSYANQTQFDQVKVYHNQPLEAETKTVLENALAILKTADLYSENIELELCMNDGSFYPELWIYKGGIAYAFLNKAVVYNSQPDFKNNSTEFSWEANNFETRKANLTWLLAHEFTHALQSNHDRLSPLNCDFWKNEGHAEYISRQYKSDGKLKEKIAFLIEEENRPHEGIPVFKLEDNTIQNLSYFEYGILMQFLIEEKGMNYQSICEDERAMKELRREMMDWHRAASY